MEGALLSHTPHHQSLKMGFPHLVPHSFFHTLPHPYSYKTLRLWWAHTSLFLLPTNLLITPLTLQDLSALLFSSSHQFLYHFYWSQHPYMHLSSTLVSYTPLPFPPLCLGYPLHGHILDFPTSRNYIICKISMYTPHTLTTLSHHSKSHVPQQPPSPHHNSLTLSFNPYHFLTTL